MLHAKRFEHSGGARAAAKKLETFLSFPLEGLDVSGFLSSAVLRERHVLRAAPVATPEPARLVGLEDSTPGSDLLSPRIKRTRSGLSTGSREELRGAASAGGPKMAQKSAAVPEVQSETLQRGPQT